MEQVERHAPQQAQVAGGVALPQPALVLPKGHIQDPVQPVLNPPVCPHRRQPMPGLGGMVGDEVAGFDTGLAAHSSLRPYQQKAAQVGPVPLRVHIPQILRVVQGPTPTNRDAFVAPVHGAVRGMGQPSNRTWRSTVKVCDPQRELVLLDGQHIVGLLRPDALGQILLATDDIEDDGGPTRSSRANASERAASSFDWASMAACASRLSQA